MAKKLEKLVIVTDMDGSFLDHKTYGFDVSLPAFNKAIENGVPVSFCSSKSRAEVKPYHEQLGVNLPFIVENGSAVYAPSGFFDMKKIDHESKDGYDIVRLNCYQSETLDTLHKLQHELPFEFNIFTEMTPEEINKDCGLDVKTAALAKQKEYANVCKIIDETPDKVNTFRDAVTAEGFSYTKGGRYHGVNKGSNKGEATKILLDLYRSKLENIHSVGIGDSQNDLAMLEAVDNGYLVQKHDGTFQKIEDASIQKVPYIGPTGWNYIVSNLVK